MSPENIECLLPYTHPIVYPKFTDSGIKTTAKPNERSSVMSVRRHGFHNGFMADLSQFGKSIIHIIFVVWVFFMKAIFLSLNLKPDGGFLPYCMSDVFHKAGLDLTDFITA